MQDGIARRAEMERFWIEPPYEMIVTWTEQDGTVTKRGVKHGDTIVGLFMSDYEEVTTLES